MKKPSPLRRDAAYTLFEIMLVLGIIAVLVGSAIYMLGGVVDEAKEQRVETDKQAIASALQMYQMRNMTYPTTAQGLEALVTMPTSEPKPPRWKKLVDKVPVDPWGRPYQYEYPSKNDPTKYALYSLGPDGVPSEDDVGR